MSGAESSCKAQNLFGNKGLLYLSVKDILKVLKKKLSSSSSNILKNSLYENLPERLNLSLACCQILKDKTVIDVLENSKIIGPSDLNFAYVSNLQEFE